MDQEKWHDKVNKLLPEIGSEFSILDAEIDIDTQKQYLLCTKQIKQKLGKNRDIDVEHHTNILYSDESNTDDIELSLAYLASSDKVEAFRSIESFVFKAEGNLLQWSQLAFQESKVRLESTLTGKIPVFISSGMGGKNSLLRFFIVIFNKEGKELEEYQANLVKTVLSENIVKVKGEFEEIEFGEMYTKIVSLLPLDCEIQDVFRDTIEECNVYGDFLGDELLITNVKRLDQVEILEMLKEKEKAEEEDDFEDDSEDDIFPFESQN